MTRKILFPVIVSLVVALMSGVMGAQGGTGELTGLITDQQGLVVPNVEVTLTNSATGDVRTTVSTEAGVYRFGALPIIGTYTLSTAPKGFKKVEIKNIVLSVGTVVSHDIRLMVGAATEEVTVEGGVQLVQTQESQISDLVDRRVWQSMPLELRSQNAFIGLLAGVAPQEGSDTVDRGAAVNGARSGTGNFLVEGIDNNDQGLGGGGSLVGTGGASTTLSPDAIQEYRVIEHNFAAEYGRAGGFVTDTVLKGGTNEFHGSAFWYNRIQALAANHLFSKLEGVDDRLVRNQFGGAFGGPIVKDKTFFFGSVEIHRRRESGPVTVTGTTQQFLDFVANTGPGGFRDFLENSPNGVCNNQAYLDGWFGPGAPLAAPCPGTFLASDGLSPMGLGSIFSNLITVQPFPLATSGFSNEARGLFTGGLITYPVPVYGRVTVLDPFQQNQNRFTIKVDHKLSNNDQLNFFYLFDDADSLDQFAGGDTTLGPSSPQVGRAQNAGIVWTHSFTPTLLNQFRLGYTRHSADFLADPAGLAGGIPSIVTAFDPIGIALGPASNLPQYFADNQYQAKNDLSWMKGKHSFKAGAEFRRTQNGSSFQADLNGIFLPYGIEDLVTDMTFGDNMDVALGYGLGGGYGSWYYAEASVDPTTGQRPNYNRRFRANDVALYFQDDWRIHPRFTLNLGVRWEYFGPPHNAVPGLDSNFYFGTPVTPIIPGGSSNPFFPNDNSFAAMVASGDFQQRDHELWNKDLNNFAPRVGFAWDVLGTSKVVLRGGFGIGYDRMFNNVFENIRFNPPYFCFCSFGTFDNGVAGGALSTPGIYGVPFTATGEFVNPANFPGGLPVPSPRHMDQNMVTAYYEQANLGVQWEFAKNYMLQVNYVGTFGHKLIGIVNVNTFSGRTACPVSGAPYSPGTPCADAGYAPGFSDDRPNTNIANDNFRTNAFNSNYHSLQVTLKKSFSNGLQFNSNYTWSRALDYISDPMYSRGNQLYYQPIDNNNIAIDYGPADFDIKHRFVTSLTYELPFFKENKWLGGWQVSSIVSLASGAPFSVYDGSYDTNQNGMYNDRVSYIGPGTVVDTPKGSPVTGYIDPAYFADTVCPASENLGLWCQGGSGRNALYGPGYANWDLGIQKKFKFTERLSMNLYGNMFNVLNRANFLIPDGNLSNDTFGQSLGTRDPRVTQLGIRFEF